MNRVKHPKTQCYTKIPPRGPYKKITYINIPPPPNQIFSYVTSPIPTYPSYR